MKKIFLALLITMGITTALSAQTRRPDPFDIPAPPPPRPAPKVVVAPPPPPPRVIVAPAPRVVTRPTVVKAKHHPRGKALGHRKHYKHHKTTLVVPGPPPHPHRP